MTFLGLSLCRNLLN